MQVYIYDVDFLANGSPNFLAMRISSYHKQLGDKVTLLRKKDKLPRKLERLYILQRDEELEHPSVKLLTHPAARVYGVRYFSNWEPDAVLLACRPDYLLYPRGRDKYERSDAVQLTDNKGHLLQLRQEDENFETNKNTLITDTGLWKLSNSDLERALKSLKNKKNIYFLEPILLSRVLDDINVTEAFLHLKFARQESIRWINTLPLIASQMQRVINFFDRFKELHPHVMAGGVEFYPKPTSTTDVENIKLMMNIMQWMKTRCWQIKFSKLHTRLDSVYVHYYELLHNWSLQPHLSFMELIAQNPAKQLNMSIEEYYCHPELWTNELFRAGIELYHTVNDRKWFDNKQWMLWQYQDRYYNPTNVNWHALWRKEVWF